ncbi:MAG: 4Fe-4S cluster-binding domain-containing protein, partial [candidate division Zixibacteria bacterium]|nr:4Fe-4S cluster-binding domain-containing protein [candidate division Zixibacteria bacterium]
MFGNVKQSSETLPIDIHVFQQGGRCFAFDVRNFAVMAVNKNDAITLSLAATLSLNEIILFCQPEIDAIAIRASYRRITKLLDAGVLSSQSITTQRQPLFNRLVMMMAGGCNMGCLYCFEKDIPSFQSHNLMKRDTARRTLEWFFRYHEGNKAHVQLYGGEPLLNWPVLKFVVKSAETWANTKNIQLTKYLITNGTLLNSERIKYLKEHSVTIQVS